MHLNLTDCGKIIYIILFYYFKNPAPFEPVGKYQQGGDDERQIQTSIAQQCTQVGHDIAYEQK